VLSIFQIHFLVKSTRGITSNKFSIKDLAGTSGRLDIICRCLLATVSFGYQNIFFHTVLYGPPSPPKSIEFIGNIIKPLPSDEIRVAKLFQTLLNPQNTAQIKGIIVRNKSFAQIASELAQDGQLLLLQEKGLQLWEQLSKLDEPQFENQSLSFVLGDHVDLTSQEIEFLIEQLRAIPVSLGTQSYLASHCIIYSLIELKKRGFLPT